MFCNSQTMALDCTCVVGMITLHMFMELPPSTGHKKVSTELMCNNLHVFVSDSLADNMAIILALGEIEHIVCDSILILFANDWRHCMVSSCYLSKGCEEQHEMHCNHNRPS